jgi:peptide/nickel transport system permease protein
MTTSIATTASTLPGETPAGGPGASFGTPDGGTGLPPGASVRRPNRSLLHGLLTN